MRIHFFCYFCVSHRMSDHAVCGCSLTDDMRGDHTAIELKCKDSIYMLVLKHRYHGQLCERCIGTVKAYE